MQCFSTFFYSTLFTITIFIVPPPVEVVNNIFNFSILADDLELVGSSKISHSLLTVYSSGHGNYKFMQLFVHFLRLSQTTSGLIEIDSILENKKLHCIGKRTCQNMHLLSKCKYYMFIFRLCILNIKVIT